MSSNNENAPPQQERRRRSSIADIFTGRPSMDSSSSNGVMQKPVGSSMATAMAQAQQQSRRLSITALGLSGSPTRSQQQGPFDALRDRGQGSTGRPRRASEADETAIDEDGDYVSPMNRSRPNSPSARRVSFGTRVRVNTGSSSTGTAPDGPGSPTSSKTSSPPNAKKEGFNWGENLRTRAQRSSISAAAGSSGGQMSANPGPNSHGRSKSVVEQPPPPAPKPPPPKAPDHFQERILKGDFYMD